MSICDPICWHIQFVRSILILSEVCLIVSRSYVKLNFRLSLNFIRVYSTIGETEKNSSNPCLIDLFDSI